MRRAGIALLALLAQSGGTLHAAALAAPGPAPGPTLAADDAAPIPHFADAADTQLVTAGRQVYRSQCAHCHGRRLEGQALWQLQDAFIHQRAPALDDTGHAWQHSDEDLFRIIRSGRTPGQPAGSVSRMAAVSASLSDAQVMQVQAFIKARWTLGIRVSQAMLNPDFAGLPEGADTVAWTLPPNCSSTLPRWRADTGQ